MRARSLLAVLLAAAISAGAAGAERPGLGDRKLPHHGVYLFLQGSVEGRFVSAEIPTGQNAPIVLHRGFATGAVLKWVRASLVDKQPIRLDGAIVVVDRRQGSISRWEFTNGYPVKWEGPEFDATKSDLAIETIEIAHEGLQLSNP